MHPTIIVRGNIGMPPASTMRDFDHRLTIAATPLAVLDAFFVPSLLRAWWQVTRSLCVPRRLGSYAVEWEPTEYRDDVLGRLGGVFHGTVIDYKPGRECFVADAYWLPPDGEPIGPMAFEVTCAVHGTGTVLKVRQSGWENSARWTRYYDVMGTGMIQALDQLKRLLEQTPAIPAGS
jgi:uncharacterized protein YndB with AHSA1/START domain